MELSLARAHAQARRLQINARDAVVSSAEEAALQAGRPAHRVRQAGQQALRALQAGQQAHRRQTAERAATSSAPAPTCFKSCRDGTCFDCRCVHPGCTAELASAASTAAPDRAMPFQTCPCLVCLCFAQPAPASRRRHVERANARVEREIARLLSNRPVPFTPAPAMAPTPAPVAAHDTWLNTELT